MKRDRTTPRPRGRSHTVGRGEVGTGEFAHEWALILQAELQARDEPIAVVFDQEPPDYARRLLDTLGVHITVGPTP